MRGLLRFLVLRVQHRLEVPGQQRLDLLDAAGRRQMLKQIVQSQVAGLDPEPPFANDRFREGSIAGKID